MFSSGTKSIICTFCILAMGNPRWPEILDLFGQSKITWSDLMVNLKVQSTHCEEQRTVQMFKPFVELKND
jgi:hypothetical protein